jgi:hypothetical protein
MACAQDLTVSKDSIKVYNSLFSSYADEVLFTSHSVAAIHLDSARVTISEMDTVSFSYVISRNLLEVFWRSNVPSVQAFYWTMDSLGQGMYRLKEKAFDPSSALPLVFSGNNTTSQILGLEIGIFLFGETRPQYPKYIKGTMSLYFSNGQAVELKLWSQDLRTGVVHPSSGGKLLSEAGSTARLGATLGSPRRGEALWRSKVNFYSINGKNITADVMKGNYFQRTGIVVVKITENGRNYYLKELLTK